jgi:hypothetical protein
MKILVSKDKKPWFLVEVKLSSKGGINKNLANYYFIVLTKTL